MGDGRLEKRGKFQIVCFFNNSHSPWQPFKADGVYFKTKFVEYFEYIKKIPQKKIIEGGNIWQIIIDGLVCIWDHHICVWNNVHRNVIVGVIARYQQGCLKTSGCRSFRYIYLSYKYVILALQVLLPQLAKWTMVLADLLWDHYPHSWEGETSLVHHQRGLGGFKCSKCSQWEEKDSPPTNMKETHVWQFSDRRPLLIYK